MQEPPILRTIEIHSRDDGKKCKKKPKDLILIFDLGPNSQLVEQGSISTGSKMLDRMLLQGRNTVQTSENVIIIRRMFAENLLLKSTFYVRTLKRPA